MGNQANVSVSQHPQPRKAHISTTTRISQLFYLPRRSSMKRLQNLQTEIRIKKNLFSKTRLFPSPCINQVSFYISPSSRSKLLLMKTGFIFLAKECCLLSLCPYTVLWGLIRPRRGDPFDSFNPAFLTLVRALEFGCSSHPNSRLAADTPLPPQNRGG